MVSHEMRNPLNSINSMILKIKMLLESLQGVVAEQKLHKNIVKTIKELFNSCDVLQSSSKLLNFCVNDMLSLSQINSDKFRKNCSNIDIRKTVNEIIAIQQEKADFNSIKIKTEFDFDDKYLVCTDEQRL